MSLVFDNEEFRIGKGYPSIVRFFNAGSEKPLVVFFPGWAHLGRISYGFPGCKDDQFLAHWIVRKGYSFLAISYPIDHPVYPDVFPQFSLANWGQMSAEITRQFIEENDLRRDIIGISWSAAGQVVRPFNVACQRLGLNVFFHLVVESSPALIMPMDRTIRIKTTTKNLVSVKESHYAIFWKQIEEQSRLNGHEIIPKERYFRDFVGDFPVSLLGTNDWFENGVILDNIEMSFKDKNFFAFTEYPPIAVVSGNSRLTTYHPFVDKWTWGFLITRKVYHHYLSQYGHALSDLSEDKYNELVAYVNEIPNRLHTLVPGNHFLFLGRMGAEKIAEYVGYFEKDIVTIKNELASFFE